MKRKKLIVALLILSLLGVVLLAGDNPDWTLPVSIRAQEIGSLAVDIASQSISELNIRITSQSAPITIEPASGVVFNISGDVNATIQGSASVSIDNATITVDVATIKEKASELGNITYAFDMTGTIKGGGGTYSAIIYTNKGTSTVYLELITPAFVVTAPTDNMYTNMFVLFEISIRNSRGGLKARFYTNPPQVISFDPAVPLEPGDYIEYQVVNYAAAGWGYIAALIRTS